MGHKTPFFILYSLFTSGINNIIDHIILLHGVRKSFTASIRFSLKIAALDKAACFHFVR